MKIKDILLEWSEWEVMIIMESKEGRRMKKMSQLMSLLVMLFLVSCSSIETKNEEAEQVRLKEQNITTIFEWVKDDILTTTTLIHADNRLIEQETISVIPYDSLGLKSKSVAKSLLKVMDKKFANLSGIDHSFEFKENEAIENLTIDFSVVSESDLGKIPGEGWLSESSQLVDYQTLAETLLANGFVEK